MLSYILIEMLCTEHERDRRSEADAERLLRACQLQSTSSWHRAYALGASCMLARVRQAWPLRRSHSTAQS